MPHTPWLILVTVYGACIGSLLNVVIYRLPEGISIVTPRSMCPKCHHRVAWFDNVPVISWLWLRGRCRFCKTPISVQYPCIELLCAAMFAGVFLLDYASGLRPEFVQWGLAATWPVLVVQLVLVGALLAATVIDARLYIIPIRIPQTVTLAAVLVLPTAAIWLPAMEQTAPVMRQEGIGAVAGGAVGLAVALLLLHFRLLPRSFDEVEQAIDEDPSPDAFLDHPHPRREVLKECLFVFLPCAGALVGYASGLVPHAKEVPLPLMPRVLAGVVAGYLVGAAVVWGVRILGTLVFGREAMGLGDVHLLAAIGSVMGASDAVLVFFLAPFFGLAGAVILGGLQRLWRSRGKVIPYGPYLALAAGTVMVFRQSMWEFFGIL